MFWQINYYDDRLFVFVFWSSVQCLVIQMLFPCYLGNLRRWPRSGKGWKLLLGTDTWGEWFRFWIIISLKLSICLFVQLFTYYFNCFYESVNVSLLTEFAGRSYLLGLNSSSSLHFFSQLKKVGSQFDL